MGVDLKKATGMWRARISVNGRRIELGSFAREADARACYASALAELGPTRVVKERRKTDPATRFLSKTEQQPNGCILWTGAKDKDGYGKFQLNGHASQQHVRAHRYAYFLHHGVYPRKLALHSCDTPSCVNPAHLNDGDQAQNIHECIARGRHRPGRVGRPR